MYDHLKNSQLWPWYQYITNFGTLETILPDYPIKACVPDSCSSACVDATALFRSNTNNLQTCGTWVVAESYLEASELSFEHIEPFEAVGIDVHNNTFVGIIQQAIGDCFADVYRESRITSQIHFLPSDCTNAEMWTYGTFTLPSCVDSICTAGIIDQDIGGIGVLTSLIMQSCIAILSVALLLVLNATNIIREPNLREEYSDALITALIEFHKSQCYFAIAIEIATCVYRSNQETEYEAAFAVLFALTTCGYVPIAFILVCIGHFARQSWYMIILSICSLAASTFTLPFSDTLLLYFAEEMSSSNFPQLLDECGGHSLQDTIHLLCGRDDVFSSPFTASPWTIRLTWATMGFCYLTLAYCIIDHLGDIDTTKGSVRWLSHRKRAKSVGTWLRKRSHSYRIPLLILLLPPWLLVFGWQFYLYSQYFTHREISTTWTFGQIIAITVWVPSLAEFANLLYNGNYKGNNYRLGRTKTVVGTT